MVEKNVFIIRNVHFKQCARLMITKTDDSRAGFILVGSGWSLFKLNLSNQREM